jgi:hypothetical protein
MQMENSNYFLESVKKRGQELTVMFHKQLTATSTSTIYKQSSDVYLGWSIKHEFKALHTLFEKIPGSAMILEILMYLLMFLIQYL